MRKWIARARNAIADRASTLVGRRDDGSELADSKLAAILSYAEFCRGGAYPRYPLEMFLEISNVCDLKCAMCVQFSGLNAHRFKTLRARDRGFFEFEEMAENLQDALKHTLLVHCFGYGEPTIHPGFKSLLGLVSKFDTQIDFFTNGMHLDDDICNFLVDNKIYKVTVSFSGSTKEMYENIYLNGNFDRVLAGVKRLSETKKSRQSRYPIIEVNSLGFKGHVETFESFVELMAANGVNIVYLKKLQHHKVIPQLYEHVSVMRPGVEDIIVERAVELGRRLGVDVKPELYLAAGASDDDDYERRMRALRELAEASFSEEDGSFGENPIDHFRAIAGAVSPIRDHDPKRPPRPALKLGIDKSAARKALEIGTPSGPPFHCMEPFKTLYVTRNGEAKPCCNAHPHGYYLGDVRADDAIDVWRGAAFEVVRDAVAQGDYPMKTCGVCLRNKSGPQGHFTRILIDGYLDWRQERSARSLRRTLAARDPEALRLIGESTAGQIMARRQGASAAVG